MAVSHGNGNKQHQPEGFKLMLYRCTQGHYEMIWNSRNAVTPFMVGCRFCKTLAEHIQWERDEYLPDHKPAVGTRVFIDLTLDKARKYRMNFVAEWWNKIPVGSSKSMKDLEMYEDEEDAVEKLARSDMATFAPHTPSLAIVGIDIPVRS